MKEQICGTCAFFKPTATDHTADLGFQGRCTKPGLELEVTFENWNPIQAIEANKRDRPNLQIKIDKVNSTGVTCFISEGRERRDMQEGVDNVLPRKTNLTTSLRSKGLLNYNIRRVKTFRNSK